MKDYQNDLCIHQQGKLDGSPLSFELLAKYCSGIEQKFENCKAGCSKARYDSEQLLLYDEFPYDESIIV